MNTSLDITVGTTNVYADLGVPDPKDMQRKGTLVSTIAEIMRANGLDHETAAKFAHCDAQEFVAMTRGRFRHLREEQLQAFVRNLQRNTQA